MTKRKIVTTISIVVVLLGFLVVISPNILGLSTTKDLELCKSIANNAKESISQEIGRNNIVIYCSPGVEGFLFDNLPNVSVYNFTSQNDQSMIVSIFEKSSNKPFHVTFYEKENIRIMKDSTGKVVGKKREKEVKLNSLTIR